MHMLHVYEYMVYSNRFVYKIVPIFYLVVNDDSLFLFLWRCLAGILVLLGGQIEKEGRRERDVSWCFVACFWRLWGLLVDLNTGTFWLFFLYFLLKMLERDIFGFWIVRRYFWKKIIIFRIKKRGNIFYLLSLSIKEG